MILANYFFFYSLSFILGINLSFYINYYFLTLFLFILFFVAFGIEAALVPFHTWLPDGHSAAPSSISMILAGVLLKMGTYGILRIPMVFFPDIAEKYGIILIIFGVLNLVYGAFNAFRQVDIKYLIAYSSISHMGVVFIGLGANNDLGVSAAVFQMVSHGLISALLFSIAGSLQYRTNTRLIDNYGGLMRVIPFIGAMLVFSGMANLGLPGLSGFVAELLSMSALLKKFYDLLGIVFVIISLIGVFITAVYVLNLIDKVLYRKTNIVYVKIQDAHWDEKLHMLVLASFILVLGIFPWLITDISNLSKIMQILGM